MKHIEEEIKQRIRNLAGKQIIPVISAKVVSVQVQSKTCTIEFADGFQLPNVRLKAAIDDSEEFIILFPRPESEVLISPLTNDSTEYYVIAVNEVDSVKAKIGSTVLEVTKDIIKLNQKQSKIEIVDEAITIYSQKKIVINNGLTSLKTIMNSVVDAFSSIKVLTGSPGSLSPVDPTMTATVAQLKGEIAKLLD